MTPAVLGQRMADAMAHRRMARPRASPDGYSTRDCGKIFP
jgi:hypothetical protein